MFPAARKNFKKISKCRKRGTGARGNGLPRPLAGPRNDVQRAGRGARPNKEPCSPSDALLAAGLDRESGGRYNKNRKRRCRKAAPPDYWFIKIEKPSLGRVAVSAFYGDGDRVFPYMKRQCNRHDNTSFRRCGGTAFLRLATPALTGKAHFTKTLVFCQSKHRRGRERTDCRTSVRTGSQ